MRNRHHHLKVTIALLFAVSVLPVFGFGQISEQEQRVAAFKRAVPQSMAGLRKYE